MGRETHLTEDVHKRVVLALKGAAPKKDAAAYGGVSEYRVDEWCRRGHAYDEHLNAGGPILDGEDRYRLFALDCDQAIADARVSASATLRKAWTQGDWRAALAFLERTDPVTWARTQKTELTGAEGGAIRIADVTDVERRLVAGIREVAAAQAALPASETFVDEPFDPSTVVGEIADADLIDVDEPAEPDQ